MKQKSEPRTCKGGVEFHGRYDRDTARAVVQDTIDGHERTPPEESFHRTVLIISAWDLTEENQGKHLILIIL